MILKRSLVPTILWAACSPSTGFAARALAPERECLSYFREPKWLLAEAAARFAARAEELWAQAAPASRAVHPPSTLESARAVAVAYARDEPLVAHDKRTGQEVVFRPERLSSPYLWSGDLMAAPLAVRLEGSDVVKSANVGRGDGELKLENVRAWRSPAERGLAWPLGDLDDPDEVDSIVLRAYSRSDLRVSALLRSLRTSSAGTSDEETLFNLLVFQGPRRFLMFKRLDEAFKRGLVVRLTTLEGPPLRERVAVGWIVNVFYNRLFDEHQMQFSNGTTVTLSEAFHDLEILETDGRPP